MWKILKSLTFPRFLQALVVVLYFAFGIIGLIVRVDVEFLAGIMAIMALFVLCIFFAAEIMADDFD